MCGLAGIFAYDCEGPPVDRAELLRIRERMAARGPDGAGEWLSPDRRIGLAHRRLSIVDLSEAGAQPMHDPDTGNVIVFNGEIYNYRELRCELEARGFTFRTQSDTEVLLKLYAADGAEMLRRLRGMFAFGLWDAQREGLLLARDSFGIKPLYYADDGRTVRFASQVKALLAGGGVDTTPDPAGHVGFFLWGHVPEPFTLYHDIRALPAGTALWAERDGRRRSHVFFDLNGELRDSPGLPDPAPKSAAEARERLRDALLDAIRHHLVADVPVGVFLSAGRDSTTVAALASEVASGPLRALTLGFREYAGAPLDETPLAAEVAGRYDLGHEVRWFTKDEFASALEPLLEAMDQPSVDGVNTYFVAQAAREAGWKVALSGLGGDEFFAGYQSFDEIPRAVRALRPLATLPALGRLARAAASPLLRTIGGSPKWAGLLEYGGTWPGAYLLRRALYMPFELSDFFDPEFLREGLERLDTLASLRLTIDGVASDRLRITALEAAWYMRNQLLRDTDWASMAHGLEVRVPLVDAELFRAVAQLCRAGFPPGKQDLGRSPRPALPEGVLARAKTGFSVPVREWLLASRNRGGSDSPPRRGLRGWAEVVYAPAQLDDRPLRTAKPVRQPEPAMRQRVALLATEMCTPGGVQAYMLRVAEALTSDPARRGHEFHCVSLNDDTEALRHHPSLRQSARVRGASRSKLRLVAHLFALPKVETLVVGHLGPVPLGWLLKAIGRARRYFLVLYGVEAWERVPWPKRWAAQRADAVIAITAHTAREFARLNEIELGRLRILPPCADERYLNRGSPSGAFKLDGASKLLCVARQDASERYKGFEMIFEALTRIQDPPLPHLNLVGDGNDQPRLRAVAAQLGIEDRVTFWGVLDDARLAAAYADCDVFVMPSKGEGFGIVFLEAMLHGKPCIGGAHGGTPEVIEHGRSGYLVEYGDVDALVRYLLALRSDPGLRGRLGARGRELTTTRFSAAAFRKRWRSLVLAREVGSGRGDTQVLAVTGTRAWEGREKSP
ncbi:MAG TPA: asparagine synthase (glutamine-hydrolyzing) [Gemmatimonadales bacterium]|nr:asparagine synthase (glutamine-hydrolyzing) [Gemmatimonadales bacterium]